MSVFFAPVANLMLTSSVDGTAKVWKVSGNVAENGTRRMLLFCISDSASLPEAVAERDLKAGPIFSSSNNPDVPTVFSFAASVPIIWDVAESNLVNRAFGLPCVDESAPAAAEE